MLVLTLEHRVAELAAVHDVTCHGRARVSTAAAAAAITHFS